jgi:hypothetical protein
MAEPTQKTNLFVDPELWRALRVRALEEGTTATELLNRAIAEFLGRKPSRAARRHGKTRTGGK